jgi:HK97 family phage major capsid protein
MSNELIKQLAERRQNIWEGAKALLDSAAAENRDLSAEESVSYDKMNADLTSLRSRIDSIEKSDTENRAAEESLTRLLGQPSERSNAGARDLNEEFRAVAAGEQRSVEIGASVFGNAFSQRALTKGAPTAGGSLVPTSFHDSLVEHMVESSGLLLLRPTVLNTTSGENLEIPVTTSYGSGALATEGSTLAGTDPAVTKRTLGAYKYGQLVLVSNELVSDSAFDISGFIARVAGRNVGLALGAHLITGTGTSQPTGVVTSASTGVTGGTGVVGVPTADNLIDLMFSVISPYRNSPSAGWLVKDSTLGAIRKLKDGAGRYLFDPAATLGQPDTLLGKPIQTDPNVAATGLGAKSVVFGDFSAYFVRIAGGVRFERSDEFKFDTDQVAFRAVIRADGITADQTGALKVFAGGAS